jgi:hypothetical protein
MAVRETDEEFYAGGLQGIADARMSRGLCVASGDLLYELFLTRSGGSYQLLQRPHTTL